MIDIEVICKHYQSIFSNAQDVFDWVEHDLRRMGLSEDEFYNAILQTKQYLKIKD